MKKVLCKKCKEEFVDSEKTNSNECEKCLILKVRKAKILPATTLKLVE